MSLNFPLTSTGRVSNQFYDLGIFDFISAAKFIQELPYKRNADKENDLCVFNDLGGTCSTKHATLKNLASENNFTELRLMLGIFLMNRFNTPKIALVLNRHGLDELPEAHNYLRYRTEIYDYTRKNSSPENFIDHLVEEVEIQSSQITDFKVAYHRNFLKTYLRDNSSIPYSLEEFWKIREECIQALQV